MSRVGAFLEGIVLGAYERLEAYNDVFLYGTHPNEVTWPPPGSEHLAFALMRIRTDKLRIQRSREHAEATLGMYVQEAKKSVPTGREVRVFRDPRHGLMVVMRASPHERASFIRSVLNKARNHPGLDGTETLQVGVATPFEGAFCVQWMRRRDQILPMNPGQQLTPQVLRGPVIRMMHEIGLRRMQIEGIKGALFALGREVTGRSQWVEWGDLPPGRSLSGRIPPWVPEVVTLRMLRELHKGTPIERVGRLAELHELIVKDRLHQLAIEIRDQAPGARVPIPQVYEFYATAYLALSARLMAGIPIDPEEDGDSFPFGAGFLVDPTEEVPIPDEPSEEELGPEHYGYQVLPYEKK